MAMRRRDWRPAAVALAVALAPGLAAAQPVASGDCQRVRQIERDTPVAGRFNARYRGVEMFGGGDTGCGRDFARVFALSPSAGGGRTAEFQVSYYGVWMGGPGREGCVSPQTAETGVGTASIWQAVGEKDGLCDLTIFLRLRLNKSDGSLLHDSTYQLQPQGPLRFVLTPPVPTQGVVASFYRQ